MADIRLHWTQCSPSPHESLQPTSPSAGGPEEICNGKRGVSADCRVVEAAFDLCYVPETADAISSPTHSWLQFVQVCYQLNERIAAQPRSKQHSDKLFDCAVAALLAAMQL